MLIYFFLLTRTKLIILSAILINITIYNKYKYLQGNLDTHYTPYIYTFSNIGQHYY